MTKEELQKKLLTIEEYERNNYQLWLNYQEKVGWEQLTRKEQHQLWEPYQQWAEKIYEPYAPNRLSPQIPVLSYLSGSTGKLGETPLVEPNEEPFVLLSRDLVTQQNGIQKWMMIQKHARFGACFPHRHSFLEINYCYSGTVVNVVNGKEIEMKPGDLLLMEPGCVHNINVLGEEDILINFVCFPSAMLTVLEKILPGECELSRFLTSSMYNMPGKMNYLFCKTSQEPKIQETVEELLGEYYDTERIAAEALFDQLIRLVFTRLWRFSEEHPELTGYNYRPDSKISRVIAYIRKHCVDCTRESVAAQFGYSGSRISSLLTEHLGISFVRLRNEFRLERIEELLQMTNLPVQTIAEQSGFFNQSYFYRTYKAYFGHLPREEQRERTS